MIADSDEDITYFGRDRTIEAKRSLHVSEAAKGMLALTSGPFIETDFDVDIWHNGYYG